MKKKNENEEFTRVPGLAPVISVVEWMKNGYNYLKPKVKKCLAHPKAKQKPEENNEGGAVFEPER